MSAQHRAVFLDRARVLNRALIREGRTRFAWRADSRSATRALVGAHHSAMFLDHDGRARRARIGEPEAATAYATTDDAQGALIPDLQAVSL